MSSFVSSNANRFYAALESSYGRAAAVTSGQRLPAAKLDARQTVDVVRRFDKTGTRTYSGSSGTNRRLTAFELRGYLAHLDASKAPLWGALFQAALGGSPRTTSALVVSALPSATLVETTTAHQLSIGSAVSFGGDIRFVTSVPDAQTVAINAPFLISPQGGDALAPATTYGLTSELPSLTIYDYWDPSSAAISRILVGAVIDTFQLSIGGDVHAVVLTGPAADLLDSQALATETAGLQTFPAEPALVPFRYSIVPGDLGQVWLGSPANQFYTLTEAVITLRNNVALRAHDYGSSIPAAGRAGEREVVLSFSLLAQDDAGSEGLYRAATNRTPLPAMFQLGRGQGQTVGIFLPKVVLEKPLYEDSQPRLLWEFSNNLVQGRGDDEIVIAIA